MALSATSVPLTRSLVDYTNILSARRQTGSLLFLEVQNTVIMLIERLHRLDETAKNSAVHACGLKTDLKLLLGVRAGRVAYAFTQLGSGTVSSRVLTCKSMGASDVNRMA